MWQNFLGLMRRDINRIRYIMPTKWYLGVGAAICCVGHAGCQTLECWARVSGYQGLQSVRLRCVIFSNALFWNDFLFVFAVRYA